MIRLLLVALLVALPALAAEDFTDRDSCYWLINVFDDNDVASAEIDHCDADPDQKGRNDIDWAVDTTAQSDAPSGSPSGADSTWHDGTYFSAGSISGGSGLASADFTAGGWWKFAHNDHLMVLIRYGNSGNVAGQWHSFRRPDTEYRWKTDGTIHANPDSPVIPDDVWTFIAWSHDAGSDEGEMRSYTSTSAIDRTLFDCTGGTQDCRKEATPMSGDLAVTYGNNVIVGDNMEGNVYESWFYAELLSEEEVCQICRCGAPNDVRGVGRVDVCNRCDVPAYQGCRRIID